ncbi:hypothetical protein LIER_02419 [Lithospermum erythrorhizon]|uniref:NAC domain-containing protein n=1 Tax=Lithospermum erythrorhizon TaxID=34254 RepID=A0AAV3NQ38_LITER
MGDNLPPGFRFHPTDEELITCYLSNKVSDFSFSSRAIIDVDLNKCEPWDLPARASMGEKEWYFFSQRDRKYPTGLRTNRATEAGYWKTTGKDKEIYGGGVLVGMKKTLVFYNGRAPKGEKTNWVMHEYRHESKLTFKPTKEEWVVCRVFQKSTTIKRSQPSCSSPQSLESPCDTNTIINEFGDMEVQNTSEMPITPLTNMINNPSSLSNFNISGNDMNLNSWLLPNDPATTLASLANWPAATSTLLGSNLSVNSLLLRTLQLRNNIQSSQVANNDYNSLFFPQGVPQIEDNNNNNNINVGLSFGASSSPSSSRAAFDTLQDQQSQDQPFDLDSSMW